MSGASGGRVPPGSTLFTHFFIHFPARPGGPVGFSLVLRIFRIFEEKEEIMGHIIWQFVKWFAIGVVAFLIVMVLLSDLGMLGIAASGVLVAAFSSMLAALINAAVTHSKYKDNPPKDIREDDRREKEYNVRLAKLMAAIVFPCIAIWAIAVYCLIIV